MLMTECKSSISPSLSSKQRKTGKEGTRGAEAWRRNRNKPIGERTPASLEEKPFSHSPSPVLSLSAAHTGNHLGWTSSFHPAG